MTSQQDALDALKATSRTFYIPIGMLPPSLQEAVMSAYLLMRAIDEIEDHPELDNPTKAHLLQTISVGLQTTPDDIASGLNPYQDVLAEVTIRINEWASLAPATIAPRIWDATAAMADRMAYWANKAWRMESIVDLDQYTFDVAGTVGLLLSDLWAWHDGTRTDRQNAIGFGRGLQAVNILRNRAEDLMRGVDFFPDNWDERDMMTYARRNLSHADAYVKALSPGPALTFCRIPLTLAHATLDAIARGESKLARSAVVEILNQLQSGDL